MATLLAYYSSPALSQAEQHLSRWTQRYNQAKEALQTVEERAAQFYPLTGYIFAYQVVGQRIAYVRAEESRVARYAQVVAQAKNMVAAERASAYLSHVAAEQAQADQEPWLVRVAGTLVMKLIQLIPSRVSQPALA